MSADIELNWEWPADRKPDQKLLVKVSSIKADSGGLFLLKKPASIVEGFPDPYVFEGTIENTSDQLDGKTIKLILPKLELENVTEGGYVVIGEVNPSTCICIVNIESRDTDISEVSCP
ncbi:MAG: hypothetical protein K6L76_04970 [Agarilytica sp.]